MWTAPTIESFRQQRHKLMGSVAFVPTMGALHDGHVALMRAGAAIADHVVVSIFVNPTQFAPGEDFERYPRPLDRDLEICRSASVAGVFVPNVEQMYPRQQLTCEVNVPALASVLEGEFRPQFFGGVCRVVAKLLNIVQPDIACFGQKDYQQYKVIQAMIADLCMPVSIQMVPTVREADGLAMSSRNVYLTAAQRPRALGLHKALVAAAAMIQEQGETDPLAVEATMRTILAAHQLRVDYAVVRHAQTLQPVDCIEPALAGVVALIAAHCDQVRLIDNLLIPSSER